MGIFNQILSLFYASSQSDLCSLSAEKIALSLVIVMVSQMLQSLMNFEESVQSQP